MADVTVESSGAATPVPDVRPRAALVATGLVVAAGTMFTAGLVGVFMSLRDATPAPGSNWVPSRIDLPNAPLVMAGLTALMASVTVQWSVWASKRDERGHAFAAIGLTLVLGLAYLNMVFASMNKADMVIGSSMWANLAFTLTGASLALTIAALVFIALMGVRAIGGDLGPAGTVNLAAAAMFWHFTVAAWAAVWYVVYVVK